MRPPIPAPPDSPNPTSSPRAVFWSPQAVQMCEGLVEIVQTNAVAEIPACLDRVRAGVAQGLTAAGFLAYEAAPGLDPALTAHPPDGEPLLWFGLFRALTTVPTPTACETGAYTVGAWTPRVDRADYLATVARIRALIAAGDTYQTNYTFPMDASFSGDAFAWFLDLRERQQAAHAAFLDLGRFAVVSASPELFFHLDGDRIVTRPMKGTRPRGLFPQADEALRDELASSVKDQAENIMIVDLLRNDLGRISEIGSVEVPDRYHVERYETVWQMTSTVAARTQTDVPEILRALFPCGSVTGAPKRRTMEIIRELEPHRRGVYCGAVGWWGPGRRAAFNVAIRTAWLDRATGSARYHVGGGITWDSAPEGEYDECMTKAALLRRNRPRFALLESLRLEDGRYWILDAHLERLAASADYFGFPCDLGAVRASLESTAAAAPAGVHKVRLLLDRTGRVSTECAPIAAEAPRIRLGLARDPVDPTDFYLYHKTTHSQVYDDALAARADCDDVLLWNTNGEVTEATRANVVVELDGVACTPPVTAGLLGGTFRRELLEQGAIVERTLRVDELPRAGWIRLINSVRGWMDTEWAGPIADPALPKR